MSVEPVAIHRCGVLGSPIAHSLSPALHRAAYGALGLAWEYDAHDVPLGALDAFLAGLGGCWRGLSVTMPLKAAALGHCADVDEAGAVVGAVNTLVRRADAPRGWSGANTDVVGFQAALAGVGVRSVGTGAVLGAGATAASAVHALGRLGAGVVHVVARSLPRAAALGPVAARAGVELRLHLLPSAAEPVTDVLPVDVLPVAGLPVAGLPVAGLPVDVLVSTIPAAAQGPIADRMGGSASTVLDVVYAPAETPLLAAARRAGRTAIPGFELLLHQAARQVELMTGCARAPIEEMRAAGERELSRRSA